MVTRGKWEGGCRSRTIKHDTQCPLASYSESEGEVLLVVDFVGWRPIEEVREGGGLKGFWPAKQNGQAEKEFIR